jgi:glycosyltransferase involved in cell wall biosynthesis
MRSLWVVLPAHNEAAHIGDVVAGVRAVRIAGVDVTALVVDDGSADGTAEIARAAGAEVISHARNRGVGAAFRTGRDRALEAGADLLLHMDSDGQILAREIPLVVEPVLAGRADLALGSRFVDGGRPEHLARWKALGLTSIARGIGLLTGYRLTDVSCGFRCMNRRVMEAVRPTFDYDYIQETLIQALAVGARVVEVPVTVLYDEEPPSAGGKQAMSARTFRYGRRFLALTAYGLAGFYRRRLRGA